MKNFISVNDVSDINGLVAKALDFKANPLKNQTLGQNKRIGLLFLNPSMRTRLSTQIAAENLGMKVIVFNVGGREYGLSILADTGKDESAAALAGGIYRELAGN